MVWRLLIAIMIPCLAPLLGSCDDNEVRPERIDKLRAIGISPAQSIVENPSAPTPIAIKVYAVVPTGTTIDGVATYQDEKQGILSQAQVTVDAASLTYEDLGALQLISVDGVVTVPPVPNQVIEALNGAARVRYGVRFTAGSESENIVSDIFVVKPGDESLNWQPPVLTLVQPGDQGEAAGTPTKLLATVDKTTDESIKLLWFVSTGQVANPQGRDTEWEETEAGDQGVIVAIYPRRSRAFRLAYKKVTIPGG